MDITINLDIPEHLSLDTVIGSRRVIIDYTEDGEEYETRDWTIGDAIVEKVANTLIHQTRDRIVSEATGRLDATIDEQLDAIVRERLEHPIIQTSPWGERKGEPITLTEAIVSRVDQFINKPNDYHDRGKTAFGKLLDDAVDRAFAKELTKAIDAAKAQAKAAVQAKAAEVLAETIARMAQKGA